VIENSIVARPAPARRTRRALTVLLAHELFPPDFAGGGEYIVTEIARHLQAIGHAVTVVTTGDPSLTEYQGMRTVRLPVSRYRMNLAWRKIADLARDADVIHAFTYHAIYPSLRAGKALGKPVVGGVLGLFGDVWLEMRGPVAGRLWRRMERYLMGLPLDVKLHLSDFSLSLSHRLGVDRPGDRVVVPGISHGQYYAHDDRHYVLYTGKIDVRKGIGLVLKVAERLPDVPFRIVGWGEAYDEVAAAAPANVRMERRPEGRNHYLEALAGARIFLFPTKVETFGLVLPEAMAAGCAIVSTSPLPFEGVRIGQDDVDTAVAAVRALWDDPAACARHGKANQEIARQYSWERYVDELEQIYWRVIDERAVRP
jgi:glycosyltransferase involved in cell wall biosynthesis